MAYKDYNNDFFGWYGVISRRNYALNIFIVSALYAALSLINFNAFEQYIPVKFLLSVLIFTAELLKLVLVMCFLSLVYRRTADFASSKPLQFRIAAKRIFVLLYVIPVMYLLCVRYFFNFMPLFTGIMDAAVFFGLIPAAALCALVLCFVKEG